MNVRRTVMSLTAVLCLGIAAPVASAQDSIRVAIANPARIFIEMQETKDLRQKVEQDTVNINNEGKARLQKVKDLQAARDLLKPDSPQYAQADQAFMQEAIQFDTWQKITQATMQGQQKTQMKTLFDKIVASTSAVAQQQGYDLVIADQRPDLPENLGAINVEQLRDRLNGRNVLFAGNKVDITPAVVQDLDAKYKASGGGAAAGPAGGAGAGGAGGAAPAGGGAAAPAPAQPAPAQPAPAQPAPRR